MHSIIHHQRQKQDSLSVILYLDIKNAFNAINHRAIFSIFEACGFPAADIALLQRMYTVSFLVMKNKFGESAACMLSRGAMRGAQPSPRIYSVVFNPIQVLIRFLKRRWTAADDIDPSSASVFVVNTDFSAKGPHFSANCKIFPLTVKDAETALFIRIQSRRSRARYPGSPCAFCGEPHVVTV
jgi:hypothetical protein